MAAMTHCVISECSLASLVPDSLVRSGSGLGIQSVAAQALLGPRRQRWQGCICSQASRAQPAY